MALTLSSAARLANPSFGNIEQLGQDIGSLSARRRQRGMLTDLLGPALDPTASSSDISQAAMQAAAIDPQLAIQLSGVATNRLAAEQNRRTVEQERARQRAERTQARTTESIEEGQKLIQLERAKALATNRGEDGTDDSKENFRSLLASELITPEQYIGLALKPKSKNTTIKVEDVVGEDGKVKKIAVAIDDSGNKVGETVLGGVPADESKSKPFMDTTAGSALYQAAVAEKNKVEGDISRFDGIIAESERLAGESGDFTGTPFIGGVLGDLTDFAVSDVAGLGNEITAFRTSLNEIQMQKALALLPKGPASDRDVQLALRASPDLKDYNEEQRVAALRGMKKIMEARRDYLEGKVTWMQVTNDANAIGYELHAEIKGYDKNIENLQETYSDAIKEMDGLVQRAREAKANGNDKESERLFALARQVDESVKIIDAFGNPVEGLGYIKSLEDRGKASVLLDKSLSRRGVAFEDVRGI
jgi:predicted component of type VI protein secretion system